MDSTVAVHTNGFWILVPGLEKGVDGQLQIGDAAKDAAADGLVVEVPEPSFHQIQPVTGTGGYEMRHEAWMALQPLLTLFVLVCAVVVHNQM